MNIVKRLFQNKFHSTRRLLCVGLIFTMWQCTGQAPRGNPLDPLSSSYIPGNSITGKCTAVYVSSQAISGAEVDLFSFVTENSVDTTSGLETRTDNEGEFKFERLEPGQYQLRFRKPGFADEKTDVALSAGQPISVEIGLDRLPIIDSTRITTTFSELNDAGESSTRLEAFFGVSDADRTLDIENLKLTIPDHSISRNLTPGRDRDKWQTSIALDSTALRGNPEQLLGAPIFVEIETATNSKRRTTKFGPFFVTRFVRHDIEIISPVNDETVGQRPTFLWPEPNFSFSYTANIDAKRIISFDTFEGFLFENISDTTLTPFGNLPVGDYFWVLEFEDEFGNKSRTKPETFKIRASE